MKGYTAITGWIADVPPAILADVYLQQRRRSRPAAVEDHDLAGTDRCRHRGVRRGGRHVADGSRRVHHAGHGRRGVTARGAFDARWRLGWTARRSGGLRTPAGTRSACSQPWSARTAAALGDRRANRGRQEDERGADGRGGARPDRPGRQDRDRRCAGTRSRPPRTTSMTMAASSCSREGEPAGPVRRTRRTAMGPGPGRSHRLPIRVTAGSPPAPSRCCPRPRICRSRTSARCS